MDDSYLDTLSDLTHEKYTILSILNQDISLREAKGTRKIKGIDRDYRKNQSIYINYRAQKKLIYYKGK